MSFELVILDCDGVLVDSEPVTERVLSASFAAFGFAMTPDEAARVFRKGGTLADELQAVEERFGRPVPESFTASFRALLYRTLADVPPIPGVLEALAELRWPSCVASNGPLKKLETTLGAIGLWERYQGRVFSAYQRERPKPAPDLFLTAAEALGASPSRCVVVEDSLPGVQAGRAAGMTVCAYVAAASREEVSAMQEAEARTFTTMEALPALLRELEQGRRSR